MGYFQDLKDGYAVGEREREKMDEDGFDPTCAEDVLTWRGMVGQRVFLRCENRMLERPSPSVEEPPKEKTSDLPPQGGE
jgi:hypothetical protein